MGMGRGQTQGGMLGCCVPARSPHQGLIHRGMHLPVPVFQAQGAMRCVQAPMGWERVVRKGLGGDGSGSVDHSDMKTLLPLSSQPFSDPWHWTTQLSPPPPEPGMVPPRVVTVTRMSNSPQTGPTITVAFWCPWGEAATEKGIGLFCTQMCFLMRAGGC